MTGGELMATIVEEPDVFEQLKGRALAKVREVLIDTYAQDPEDVASDLAEALDIDEEELPKISVEIVLHIGNQTISASGFTVEEKDDEDSEDE
jgi:energy-converting hydrogenase A subunit M